MASYKIGELAELTGYSAESIRHYERIGILAHPPRTGSGQRIYGDHHRDVLMAIKTFRNSSFGLYDIGDLLKSLNTGEYCHNIELLYRKYFEILAEKRRELEACEAALAKLHGHCENCASKNLVAAIEDCKITTENRR